jgi:hypothetical protein
MKLVSRVFSFCQKLHPHDKSPSTAPLPTTTPTNNEYSDVDPDCSSDDPSLEPPFSGPPDLTKVPQYLHTIFHCARSNFSSELLSPAHLMEVQTTILLEHREIAITHMLSVQHQYDMGSDTLFQAVGYLNQLLRRIDCPKDKLHLFALTSIWMVAKLEENGAPRLSDLCFIARGVYTESDFVECERFILNDTGFQLTFATAVVFLRAFLDAIGAGLKTVEIANFFCDLSLIPIDFVGIRPDVVAMACVCLAKLTLKEKCPTKRLLELAECEGVEEPKFCCGKLIEFGNVVIAHPKHLLYQKYTAEKTMRAILEMKMSEDILECL